MIALAEMKSITRPSPKKFSRVLIVFLLRAAEVECGRSACSRFSLLISILDTTKMTMDMTKTMTSGKIRRVACSAGTPSNLKSGLKLNEIKL